MTAYDCDFWFSLGPHKRENQPLRSMRHARSIWCMTSSKRKNSVFVSPLVNEKPAFSTISTLEKKRYVFGDRFHGIRVDSRPNRGKIFVFKQKRICVKGGLKLPKHQWNTRWTFARKHGIFTRENNMLSFNVKRSAFLWLHNKTMHDFKEVYFSLPFNNLTWLLISWKDFVNNFLLILLDKEPVSGLF